VPNGCATGLIVQPAFPAASVVALQLWAVPPVPSVNFTVRPAIGVALSSRRTPDMCAVPPFAITVSPVYDSVVSSNVTPNGLETLVPASTPKTPPKLAVTA
jgi:hypothetical protein